MIAQDFESFRREAMRKEDEGGPEGVPALDLQNRAYERAPGRRWRIQRGHRRGRAVR